MLTLRLCLWLSSFLVISQAIWAKLTFEVDLALVPKSVGVDFHFVDVANQAVIPRLLSDPLKALLRSLHQHHYTKAKQQFKAITAPLTLSLDDWEVYLDSAYLLDLEVKVIPPQGTHHWGYYQYHQGQLSESKGDYITAYGYYLSAFHQSHRYRYYEAFVSLQPSLMIQPFALPSVSLEALHALDYLNRFRKGYIHFMSYHKRLVELALQQKAFPSQLPIRRGLYERYQDLDSERAYLVALLEESPDTAMAFINKQFKTLHSYSQLQLKRFQRLTQTLKWSACNSTCQTLLKGWLLQDSSLLQGTPLGAMLSKNPSEWVSVATTYKDPLILEWCLSLLIQHQEFSLVESLIPLIRSEVALQAYTVGLLESSSQLASSRLIARILGDYSTLTDPVLKVMWLDNALRLGQFSVVKQLLATDATLPYETQYRLYLSLEANNALTAIELRDALLHWRYHSVAWGLAWLSRVDSTDWLTSWQSLNDYFQSNQVATLALMVHRIQFQLKKGLLAETLVYIQSIESLPRKRYALGLYNLHTGNYKQALNYLNQLPSSSAVEELIAETNFLLGNFTYPTCSCPKAKAKLITTYLQEGHFQALAKLPSLSPYLQAVVAFFQGNYPKAYALTTQQDPNYTQAALELQMVLTLQWGLNSIVALKNEAYQAEYATTQPLRVFNSYLLVAEALGSLSPPQQSLKNRLKQTGHYHSSEAYLSIKSD